MFNFFKSLFGTGLNEIDETVYIDPYEDSSFSEYIDSSWSAWYCYAPGYGERYYSSYDDSGGDKGPNGYYYIYCSK